MICEYCNLIIYRIAAKSHVVWMQHNHGHRGFFVTQQNHQTNRLQPIPQNAQWPTGLSEPAELGAVSCGPNVPIGDRFSPVPHGR